MVNLGYTYYRNIDKTDVDFGKGILKKERDLKVSPREYFEVKGSKKLIFKTQYPGLAIGLGYSHETSKSNDDFKLGFSFDYTTGLPYIPGSTIKGTIRSLFPKNKHDTQRVALINELLGTNYSYKEIYEIEKSIFGKSTDDTSSLDDPGTKDIFYDGYFEVEKDRQLLSDDYITPHKDNPLRSPDPLKFLKIAPEVRVILQIGFAENDLISKEKRQKLYCDILSWTGLGAKTNVGYGVLKKIN